jgi:hypothetical protein
LSAVTVEYLADHREFIPAVAHWYHAEWRHLRPGEAVEDRVARVEESCGRCAVPTMFVALAEEQLLGAACSSTTWLHGRTFLRGLPAFSLRPSIVGAGLEPHLLSESCRRLARSASTSLSLHDGFRRFIFQARLVRC